jgi:hypothetical protein
VTAFKGYEPQPVLKIHTKSSCEETLAQEILKFSLLEEELVRKAKVYLRNLIFIS